MAYQSLHKTSYKTKSSLSVGKVTLVGTSFRYPQRLKPKGAKLKYSLLFMHFFLCISRASWDTTQKLPEERIFKNLTLLRSHFLIYS